MGKDRLTLSSGICAMASTEFCFEQHDCYTCSHGSKVFQKLASLENNEDKRTGETYTVPVSFCASKASLCRGKKVGSNDYVVGQLICPRGNLLKGKAYIAEDIYCAHVCDTERNELMLGGFVEVEPGSVSFAVYAGPKSSVQIFEGDLVRYSHNDFVIVGVVRNGLYTQDGSGGEYPGSDVLGAYVEAIRVLCARASECTDFSTEPSCTKWCFPEHMRTCSLLDVLAKEDIEVIPATDPNARCILQAV